MKITGFLTLSFLLFACCEDMQQLKKTDHDQYTITSDTLVYLLHPDTEFFTLPYCKGSYDCPLLDCMNVDCNAGKLFASSCLGLPYPLKCVGPNGETIIHALISGVRYNDQSVCNKEGISVEPYYNESTAGPPAGSLFDTPPPGIPSANAQGLSIDSRSGKIDIYKSLLQGVVGSPAVPDTRKTFRIYYRLNDPSHFALNYTDLTILYEPSDASSSRGSVQTPPGGGTIIIIKGGACR